MSEPVPVEVESHKLYVEAVGVISEIISNVTDERDVLRELLSNAAAKEVKAKNVNVRIFESDRGLGFTIEDDGVGMDYTRSEISPGRLDKFLNVAQGRQAGFQSDEFGAKGFGTKLLYNSREVVVETWDGGQHAYRVIFEEPRRTVLDEKKLVEPRVQILPGVSSGLSRGTKISVKGWNNRDTIPKEWKLEDMRDYLNYYTVCGYTRERDAPLPHITLRISGRQIDLKSGFPYLTPEPGDNPRTITFGPVAKTKKTPEGKPVTVTIKGGITVDTGKFGLSDWNGGVFVSIKGIPYFQISPANKYARRLGMTDDFIRFVAECDDLRLNLTRSDFFEDETLDAFESALDETFEEIRADKKFETFYKNKKKQFKVELQQFMSKKKEEFASGKKRFVWWKGRKLLAEPESEYDTAALLWMLEGAHGLPFAHFQSIQYAGSSKGIDLLVDFQEDPQSEKKIFAYAEIEKRFSNLIRHQHDVSQMSYVFCWDVDKGHVQIGKIDQTKKPYKYKYSLSDDVVTIYELKSFPDIHVGTAPAESEEN